jgi:putative heme iron utilization protein
MDAASTCRGLARSARFGALATLARDAHPWPFATLVAVAFDAAGRPLMCLSRLAEHTKNLEASERVSLLVAGGAAGLDPHSPAGPASSNVRDPLASGRMTLIGTCSRVADGERDAALARFLEVHPEASGYARFADFSMWRIEVGSVRWIGGFGAMEWVDASEYARAENAAAASGDGGAEPP